MARTSTGLGMGITVAILGVLSLALFIFFAIFYGKWNTLNTEKRNAQAEQERFIKNSERNRDDVMRLIEMARKDGNKSLVGYLVDTNQTLTRRITGSPNDSLEVLEQKAASVGAANTALLSAIRDNLSKIDQLTSDLQKSDADRVKALEDKKAEVDRMAVLEKSHADTIAALNEDINKYKNEITSYREGTDSARKEMDARVQNLQEQIARMQEEFDTERARMTEEGLVLASQIKALRGDRAKEIFTGRPEESLADAEVVGVTAADGTVIISIGQREKVTIGMSFSVFADAAAIKPDDATGAYPRGKAGLEVISVDPETATCRIVWNARGNPVVKGDVVANPIYDPRKVYKMVVYGNFDVNNDGIATPEETDTIRVMIQNWGGQVLDAEKGLAGDTDFLVLGERPVLPPQPNSGSPFEVVQNYIRLDQIVKRYDDLYEKARSTSLPVLNENRLYTLLGRQRPVRR
ncbi:MAG: hypothetical protein AMXMBFR58_08530 [Phycisphaerae bacterium]|nr:hypothetical protein [Phycisphaerales bacterium]MCK6477442.1 hypothetical protein [Phycisphaerales bacterium]